MRTLYIMNNVFFSLPVAARRSL